MKEKFMRIHACAATVASAATLAIAPLAAAHGTWWRADSNRVQSFAQMQAASSEAPAFHAGDRSIYDSSRVFETTRVATTSQPASPGRYERRSASEPAPQSVPTPSIDSAAQLDVDPAGRVSSGSVLPSRPASPTDRYGAPIR